MTNSVGDKGIGISIIGFFPEANNSSIDTSLSSFWGITLSFPSLSDALPSPDNPTNSISAE